MRLSKVLPCLMLLCMITPALAQERGKAEATISGKKVTITYGRPSLGGRDVLSLAQPGTVWRLGMNQATEIESTGDLMVAGKHLKAGKYSLWAKKADANNWVLAFHPNTGVWGAPALKEGYVAELPLKLTQSPTSTEQLTIALADEKGKVGVKIHWGTAVLSGTFDVH